MSSWRGKLNQQAVTGGSRYSPETVSSLRRRDLESQYEQAATSTPQSTSTGSEFQTQNYQQQEPVVGQRQDAPPTQGPTEEQKTTFSSNLRATVDAYKEARNKADQAKETSFWTRIGTGAASGYLSGGGAGAFAGAAVGLAGNMLGTAFGGDQDFDKRMEAEQYGRAVDLYDLFNNGEYDPNKYRDLTGNLYAISYLPILQNQKHRK